ncbi:MAG: hypothetical protein PHP54_00320 [Clostridia bacterium]|nr:hypothetical protein [Clostridia bacterium]
MDHTIEFNYYRNVEIVSNKNFEKYNLSRYIKKCEKKDSKKLECVYKQKLYNLILNICNQYVYDYDYLLKRDEINFMYDFNLQNVIRSCISDLEKDIMRYKNECKQS